MLPTRRTTSIAVILMLLVGSLACSLFSPAPTATPAPTPVAITVGPGATDTLAPPPPTDTAPAPPPTDTAPAPTPTTPPTAEPAGAVLLVVAAPDRSVGLVALDGQPHALSDAPEPLYALAALDPDPGAPARAYNFSSAGVFPAVNRNSVSPLAARPSPAVSAFPFTSTSPRRTCVQRWRPDGSASAADCPASSLEA